MIWGDITINSDLIVALVPVGFVMIVGLMTWIVRELSRVSAAVSRLDDKMAGLQGDIADQDRASIDDRRKFAEHVTEDAKVAAKVAYIEGRIRGNIS